MSRVSVHFVGLASGTTSNEFADKGGHAGPPVVFLKKRDGVKVSSMGSGEGFMDVFDEGVAGRFWDVETALVVQGALIKVPVPRGGLGKGDGGGFHGSESVNDKLV